MADSTINLYETLTFLNSIAVNLPWMQQVTKALVRAGPVRAVVKLKEALENL